MTSVSSYLSLVLPVPFIMLTHPQSWLPEKLKSEARPHLSGYFCRHMPKLCPGLSVPDP